jgi:hypothetical protein
MVMLELNMLMMMIIMVDRVHHYIHYQDHNHNHQSQQHDLMKQHKMMVVMNKYYEIDEFQWNWLLINLIQK